ncbi:MAG: hypothetical protein IKS09_01325 [Lachnospiraceae bacterium]|jgi:hypothetical protein|nr:hypothetical protein [Lachnospiraceae bacterium]
MKKNLKNDNAGMGVIEVILIIVVLVGLVFIFKGQIEGIVNGIFKSISSGVTKITG